MGSLERDAAGIGALADAIRRDLYQFVAAQPHPVSRDQAADALGIPHHQAKFHLDRLEAEGLLEADFARLNGRSGPGAGRPAKRYRRAHSDISVSLPPRDYELAGRLMANAIAEATSTGAPVIEVLNKLAHDYGLRIGAAATEDGRPADAGSALQLAVGVLSAHGYEPRYLDGEVYLANCPFHAVAQEQTHLACNMNHALITGVADALAPRSPQARLCPRQNECCVALRPGVEPSGSGPAAQ